MAQVRFPAILFIEDKSRVAPFQADLRSRYPAFRQETGQNVQIALNPSGPAIQSLPSPLWRFADVASQWNLVLAPDSVTLDTRAYESRTDLLTRLRDVLEAVERHFQPGIAERVGLRYVSRVTGAAYEQLDAVVSEGLLGIAKPNLRNHVMHAISEAAMKVEEGQLLTRWGILPPHGTFDPLVLEPLDLPSWILDIDVANTVTRTFDGAALITNFDALAQRAYAMFRFMVKEDFLVLHGGTV
jgi:uncharacterized protein (TIGR04255 family)